MNDSFIVEELVRFGKDCLRVFGRTGGVSYLKRCLPRWQEQFGEAIASQVRVRLMKAWKDCEV